MSNDLPAFALLCFSSLLAIINPLSATPMYLALTDGYTPEHRRRTLRSAILTAFAVLVTFALVGGFIFQVFGITIDAFRIAGGVIFFGIGMDMLQAKQARGKTTREEEEEGRHKEDVGITPLGIPMITGPGAITTVKVKTEPQGLSACVALVRRGRRSTRDSLELTRWLGDSPSSGKSISPPDLRQPVRRVTDSW